jgi:hypothetical protein
MTSLRAAAQVSEPSDRALAGALERLEEAAGLFLVKRNRGWTDERLLVLAVPVPTRGPMSSLVLKRFHEPMIVRGQLPDRAFAQRFLNLFVRCHERQVNSDCGCGKRRRRAR